MADTIGVVGLLTPLAVRIGALSWLPRYLPQVVQVDSFIGTVTGDRMSLLDIAGLPNITIRVRGRKSGVMRETSLLAVPDDDGSWLIAGSYFGGPKMPQWVFNLRAAGAATIVGKHRAVEATATELADEERGRAWQTLRSVWPNFDLYEQRTDRLIPVFRLTPKN